MTALQLFNLLLVALGLFSVVGVIAAVAQAAGGPVFFPARRPAVVSVRYRTAVAWS